MIDAKEAVRIALDYVRTMYEAEGIEHFVLEEVELAKDERFWFVTVSFVRPVAKSPIEAMTGQHGAAATKVLELHSETGQVHSMKNRTV